MQDGTQSPGSPMLGADRAAQVILGVLRDHYPGLMALDELVLICAGSTLDRSKAELLVADGLTELMASGLAHRLDRFVIASRAAVRAGQLAE